MQLLWFLLLWLSPPWDFFLHFPSIQRNPDVILCLHKTNDWTFCLNFCCSVCRDCKISSSHINVSIADFPGWSMVMNPPVMQESWVWFLGWEDPLGKEMANHSSILAWEILWTEEPGGLQSMGSQKSGTRLRGWTTATA